jgi:glucokinase
MLGLIGDIGGTNTRFALARDGKMLDTSLIGFHNDEFDAFPDVLRTYLARVNETIHHVCLGCAGPVRGDHVELVNWPWEISHAQIQALTGTGRINLLNDLQAQGYALHQLRLGELPRVHKASVPKDANATRLSVSIGTGVNAAVAYRQDGRVFAPPAEAGFWPLPADTEEDLRLIQYMQDQLEIVRIEAALSGAGLVRLWRYYGGEAGKNGAQVVELYSKGDLIAARALRRFALILAQYCATLALAHLPMGALVLAGSVGRAVGPYLPDLGFEQAFLACDRGAGILPRIPVLIAPEGELGLMGCAHFLGQTPT